MFAEDSDKYLVFLASMISDDDYDRDRVFVLHYYLQNKTVAIYVKKDKAKAIEPGRFLSRMPIQDPRTGENYDDDAFYVGAKIQAAGRVFELKEAPEYTLCLMEANSDRFPQADLATSVETLANHAKSIGVDLAAEFQKIDKQNAGTISQDEAKALFQSYAPAITQQVAITLMRRFVKDGRFQYQDLLHYI